MCKPPLWPAVQRPRRSRRSLELLAPPAAAAPNRQQNAGLKLVQMRLETELHIFQPQNLTQSPCRLRIDKMFTLSQLHSAKGVPASKSVTPLFLPPDRPARQPGQTNPLLRSPAELRPRRTAPHCGQASNYTEREIRWTPCHRGQIVHILSFIKYSSC